MIKFTIFLKRNSGMSHEEFVWYHENVHRPLFSSLPEVKTYVRYYLQCHPSQETLTKMALSEYDGITEIWFDDLESLSKFFIADAYQQVIRSDQEKFMDLHQCIINISHEMLLS